MLLSISKIYRIPGLRVGFLIAAPADHRRLRPQSCGPGASTASRQAAVRFLCEARARASTPSWPRPAATSTGSGGNCEQRLRLHPGSGSLPQHRPPSF
ncbi:MAG: hypothetical protein MZV70_29950 [Desulfobacterales bacterium]|nr:hypothetical protein [Desulfobacterales bacterium]